MNPFHEELLSAYLDGEVAPEARRDIEAALAADESLRIKLAELSDIRRRLAALPVDDYTGDCSAVVLKRLAAERLLRSSASAVSSETDATALDSNVNPGLPSANVAGASRGGDFSSDESAPLQLSHPASLRNRGAADTSPRSVSRIVKWGFYISTSAAAVLTAVLFIPRAAERTVSLQSSQADGSPSESGDRDVFADAVEEYAANENADASSSLADTLPSNAVPSEAAAANAAARSHSAFESKEATVTNPAPLADSPSAAQRMSRSDQVVLSPPRIHAAKEQDGSADASKGPPGGLQGFGGGFGAAAGVSAPLASATLSAESAERLSGLSGDGDTRLPTNEIESLAAIPTFVVYLDGTGEAPFDSKSLALAMADARWAELPPITVDSPIVARQDARRQGDRFAQPVPSGRLEAGPDTKRDVGESPSADFPAASPVSPGSRPLPAAVSSADSPETSPERLPSRSFAKNEIADETLRKMASRTSSSLNEAAAAIVEDMDSVELVYLSGSRDQVTAALRQWVNSSGMSLNALPMPTDRFEKQFANLAQGEATEIDKKTAARGVINEGRAAADDDAKLELDSAFFNSLVKPADEQLLAQRESSAPIAEGIDLLERAAVTAIRAELVEQAERSVGLREDGAIARSRREFGAGMPSAGAAAPTAESTESNGLAPSANSPDAAAANAFRRGEVRRGNSARDPIANPVGPIVKSKSDSAGEGSTAASVADAPRNIELKNAELDGAAIRDERVLVVRRFSPTGEPSLGPHVSRFRKSDEAEAAPARESKKPGGDSEDAKSSVVAPQDSPEQNSPRVPAPQPKESTEEASEAAHGAGGAEFALPSGAEPVRVLLVIRRPVSQAIDSATSPAAPPAPASEQP